MKLSDLRDNPRFDRVGMDPTRIQCDARRWSKDILAFEFLTDKLTDEQYREMASEVE